jgi:hypothetical protein
LEVSSKIIGFNIGTQAPTARAKFHGLIDGCDIRGLKYRTDSIQEGRDVIKAFR